MAARTGNALGFALFASLLQWTYARVAVQSTAPANAPWRRVFQAAGLIQLIPLSMLTYFGGNGAGTPELKTTTHPRDMSMAKSTVYQSLAILRNLSRRPEFWLHLISNSCIMVLVSFLLFIPSYMAQCYGISSAASARVGSFFALSCLLAVSTLAEKTYPSVATISSGTSINSYRRKAYFMLAFLASATTCLMIQTAFLRDIIHLTPLLESLLMFLFGFSLGKEACQRSFLCCHFFNEYSSAHSPYRSYPILHPRNNVCLEKWWEGWLCNNC